LIVSAKLAEISTDIGLQIISLINQNQPEGTVLAKHRMNLAHTFKVVPFARTLDTLTCSSGFLNG
jgi:hypothetical protein